MLSSACRNVFKRVSIPHPRHVASNSMQFPFPTNPNPTPHQIFHLPRNAPQAEVKARYFALVRIYHPDKVDESIPSGVVHARFQAITAAYNALRSNSSSPGQDKANAPTPAARAMYKRSRNLYSGPQLSDDSWKDRIIVAGVIFAAFCFVIQAAATRRAFLEDAVRPWNTVPDAKTRPSKTVAAEDPRLAEPHPS